MSRNPVAGLFWPAAGGASLAHVRGSRGAKPGSAPACLRFRIRLEIERSMQMRELELAEETPEGLPRPIKLAAAVGGLLLLMGAVYVAFSFDKPDARELRLQQLELEKIPSAKDDHSPLRFAMDEPARQSPTMQPVPEAVELESRRVIGVENEQVAHAYVIEETIERDALIVSTWVGDRPLVITHNYLLDETRVLTSSSANESIDLRHGGWQEDKQLVLLLDGIRYHQHSKMLPLEDWPFEHTSLADWYEEHPHTLVNFDEEKTDRNFYTREAREAVHSTTTADSTTVSD